MCLLFASMYDRFCALGLFVVLVYCDGCYCYLIWCLGFLFILCSAITVRFGCIACSVVCGCDCLVITLLFVCVTFLFCCFACTSVLLVALLSSWLIAFVAFVGVCLFNSVGIFALHFTLSLYLFGCCVLFCVGYWRCFVLFIMLLLGGLLLCLRLLFWF